jgi:hypothetical protein
MKIGIIGPNEIFGEGIKERKKLLDKVAKILSKGKNEIILTPDKGSLLEYFGEKYLGCGGEKIWLIIPTENEDHKEYLNTKLGEIVSCIDWDRQADEFNRQSDVFVCVGYSWGALKEIACARYSNKKKVYILKEFISEELPEELSFVVEYISIFELEKKLNSIKRKDVEE